MAKPSLAPVEYPYSDGEPVESDQHYLAAHHVMGVFREHFGDSANYASNNGIYYKEGDPRKLVVPDVYWVDDKPFEKKLVYLLWEEGKSPDFVLELASRTTLPRDEGKKRLLYAELGIADYFQFDPLGYLMTPWLKGFRLCDGVYQPLPAKLLPDGGIGVHSEALGLELRALRGDDDPQLRLFDPATNSLLTADSKRLREAERERDEVARANAELRALRGAEDPQLRLFDPATNSLLTADSKRLREVERERDELERSKAELERGKAELERANAELRARLAELERR